MLAKFLQFLTITLAPMYIFRIYNLPVPTTLLEIAIVITFFATSVDFLKNGSNFKLLGTKFDLLIFLFLLSAILALVKTYDLLGGLGILKAYFIEPIFFYYCLVYTSKKFGKNYIIWALLTSGMWLSTLALIQRLTGQFTFAPHEVEFGRVSAVYNSANSLALYLIPISILSFGMFMRIKNLKKFLYLGLFVFFTLIIIWTKSRGGLIAETGGLLIFLYIFLSLKNKILRRFWYVVPSLVFLGIGIFLYISYLSYSFLPPSDGRQYSVGDTLQIRYFIWIGTANLLKNNPIFGAGLNGFKTLYSEQYRLPQYQEEFQYPHNLVLTFWAETGIFGLFSFLLLFISGLGLLIRGIEKSREKIIGATLISVLSYLFLHGIVDVPYFKNDLSLEFFIIFALISIWIGNLRAHR